MWCQATQPLESFSVVVGQQKGLQVLVELFRGLVMVALDGGFFNRAVHALDLAIGPGVRGLREAVLDAVLIAYAAKNVAPGSDLMGHVAKLGAVVGQHGMHLVGQGGQYPAQELGSQHFSGAGLQLGEGYLAGGGVDSDN